LKKISLKSSGTKNELYANFRDKKIILAKNKNKITTIADQPKLQHVNNKLAQISPNYKNIKGRKKWMNTNLVLVEDP
jgi:hypothetical protein